MVGTCGHQCARYGLYMEGSVDSDNNASQDYAFKKHVLIAGCTYVSCADLELELNKYFEYSKTARAVLCWRDKRARVGRGVHSLSDACFFLAIPSTQPQARAVAGAPHYSLLRLDFCGGSCCA